MPDSKITALASIGTGTDPVNDALVIVDVSDVSPGGMSATGTTKRVSLNNLLASSPTATLASATITGDLTVATDRLKVVTGSTAIQTGATTQLQVGTTAWPTDLISKASSRVLIGNLGTSIFWNESSPAIGNASTLYIGAKTGAGATTFGGGYISAGTENASDRAGFFALSTFQSNGIDRERYRIDSTGVHTWQYVGGVASTAMTLNSTGLGVGASPSRKLSVSGAGGGLDVTDTTQSTRIRMRSSSASNFYIEALNSAESAYITLRLNDTTQIDSSGNVGIGVTPSAWRSTNKAVEVGSYSSLTSSSAGDLQLFNNAYINSGGSNIYQSNGFATRYEQYQGVHAWYSAPSGTAGNTATFTQAMTLDASGRLGVGVSPASNTRTHFKGSSTSTDYINYCVNSSDKLAFGIRNDGLLITGPSADSATLPNSPYNLTSGSAANVFVDSQGIFYRSTSSLKYKTDIADSTRGLADVLKLRPVTYKAKNSGDTVFGGLIAEEVDAAGLTEFVQYAPDNTPDAIHYGNMVSLLVAAIKELTARVQTLETR